ncbi:hypothetical protein [Pseudomonas sp. A-R-26]|jgi:hypothetical protein|uniref:hypothetical protein n=1 Tax=Pseudomonas sp. A-R-26 TaxID=2832404 RepID=UPI001CBE660A|nr:hypothetical protein [Pseudomonas sp. A-R-26]
MPRRKFADNQYLVNDVSLCEESVIVRVGKSVISMAGWTGGSMSGRVARPLLDLKGAVASAGQVLWGTNIEVLESGLIVGSFVDTGLFGVVTGGLRGVLGLMANSLIK